MNIKRHLDVGCGSKPRNPFDFEELYGVDILPEKDSDKFNYKQCNIILEGLPFEDSFFDSLSAYDFIEHIPRFAIINDTTQFPFVNFMNEVYRVLKNDGVFYAVTPVYPREEAFVDPTHINFITKKTHKYFTMPYNYANMYGFQGKFEIKRVNQIRFSQEVKKYGKVKSFLRNVLYSILYTKKGHILWEFTAKKT